MDKTKSEDKITNKNASQNNLYKLHNLDKSE